MLGRVVTLGTLATVALGCWGDDVVDEASDVRRVGLEVRFRLGELEGPAALNDVLSATVGPSGLLYVTQWQDAQVSVFGPDGRPRDPIARGGLGPGEFTMAGDVGFVGDTLWITGSPDKIGLFGMDGTLIRDVRIREPFGDDGWYYAPRQYIGALGILATVVVRPEVRADPRGRRVPILVVGFDGEVSDTLTWVEVARTLIMPEIIPGRPAYITLKELGSDPFAVSPDGAGLVVMDRLDTPREGTSHLRATWLDGAGDVVGERERPAPRQPFPPDVAEGVVSRLVERVGNLPMFTEAAVRSALEEQIEWPGLEPLFTSVRLGKDQRAWLRREERGDSARWEIWSMHDDAIEDVWLPADLEIHYADSLQVWGERWNELDVPFLYRYEIVREE